MDQGSDSMPLAAVEALLEALKVRELDNLQGSVVVPDAKKVWLQVLCSLH